MKIKGEFHHPALGIPTQIARTWYFLPWGTPCAKESLLFLGQDDSSKEKSVMNKLGMPKSSFNWGEIFLGTFFSELCEKSVPRFHLSLPRWLHVDARYWGAGRLHRTKDHERFDWPFCQRRSCEAKGEIGGGNVASGNSRPYDQGLLSMVVP